MKKIIRQFFFALSFLTVLPVPANISFDRDDFGKSSSFFPLVGLILGFLALVFVLPGFFHPLTSAVFVCVFLLFVTRGIHADGLLDTFDGFFSMKYGPEKIKRIMKDPGIGAMGFVGGFSFYLLKIAGLFEVAGLGRPGYYLITLIPALSRSGISFFSLLAKKMSRISGTSGADDGITPGLGVDFISSSGALQFIISLLLSFIFSSGLYIVTGAALVVILPLFNIAFWLLWFFLCKNRLGIISGDTMGAGIEISEVFLLFLGFTFLVL